MKTVPLHAMPSWQLPARVAVGALLAACALATQARDASSAIVGQVTMSVGASKLVGQDGAVVAVDQGTQIRVGDRVETDVNGNVFLRFVDGQMVKVRPLSRLLVENYEQTAIKFKLEEGVVRSITGKFGEAARDRFRLNTPVAAIGIKGTDFVVKHTADTTYTTVYTGAVVMAPLTEACQASLGVCRTGDEKLLSADMKGQMLEISRLQTSPRLVPAVDLLAANNSRQVPVETVARAEQRGLVADSGRPDISSDKSALSETRGATVASTTQPTPDKPVVVGPPEVRQLTWARSPLSSGPMDGDTFSKSFEAASANGKVIVAAVNDGGFYLFRQAGASQALVSGGETSANFRLAGGSGSMFVTNQVKYEPVSFNAAASTLTIDFAKASFNTQLSMTSPSLGNDTLSVSGGVNTLQSLFSGSNASGSVNGALSVDGKEAAYLFFKQVPLGTVTGATLWGR